MAPKPVFRTVSLNWDQGLPNEEPKPSPILNPRDVMQVAFLIEQQKEFRDEDDLSGKSREKGARVTLGQLCIEWRSAMGDRGFLSTGWLTSRRR